MRTCSMLLAALMVLTLARISHAKDTFEATTWNIKVSPDDEARGNGAKPFDDVLVFKGGKFTSDALKKSGFGPVDFDTDTRPGGIGGFTANAKSDTDGTAKWTGTVTATEIKGDLVWTKKDGTVLNYSYTGERKG